MGLKPTELFQAWKWICDDCGRDNYADSVTADLSGMSDEEIREMAQALGVDDVNGEIPDGAFVSMPDTVTCSYCFQKYTTERL